jgi:hypothetical protein
MMEALALREQQMAEQAAQHLKALEHEKGTVAELWEKAATSVADALPAMVAKAMETGRQEADATVAELRRQLVELQDTVARREESVAQQAAAYERAEQGLRSVMARPPDGGFGQPTPIPEPVIVVSNGGRVLSRKSNVPRSQRVERRMLKIDDADEGDPPAWPALGRREAELTEMLDSQEG